MTAEKTKVFSHFIGLKYECKEKKNRISSFKNINLHIIKRKINTCTGPIQAELAIFIVAKTKSCKKTI